MFMLWLFLVRFLSGSLLVAFAQYVWFPGFVMLIVSVNVLFSYAVMFPIFQMPWLVSNISVPLYFVVLGRFVWIMVFV